MQLKEQKRKQREPSALPSGPCMITHRYDVHVVKMFTLFQGLSKGVIDDDRFTRS